MSENVQTTRDEHILQIRLNRLDKKNALTLAMYAALADAVESAGRDPDVRAVILTGGDDCFTAGNDIADFAQAAAVQGEIAPQLKFLGALARLDKPVVAAVAGVAIGIGTTMLLHCDLVYAAPNVRFRTPFVDLGLVPEAASSLLLPALIGHRRASSLLLLGDELDAETARAWGLVNAIVADPLGAAKATAARLAARAPEALRATKGLMKRSQRALIEETMKVEGEIFGERLRSPEAREAFAAFLGKRPAKF